MDNHYIYQWDWYDGADDSTIAVATSSHVYVDTLWTKIYNNRAGFWSEDDWTRDMTRICVMTSSKYTNGLIDAIMLQPFPDCAYMPTDPDSDREFEDINGNGRMDLADVVKYFQNIVWIESNEPIVLFDYNHNRIIDLNDAVMLFHEIEHSS